MNMKKEVKLTKDGLKKLQDELENLKTVGRTDIAERIKIARGYGDLSENSEYDDAKNEQAKMEARIVEIENILKNHVIVSEDEISGDSVFIGVTVEIRNEKTKKVQTFDIVGSAEADPLNNHISDESPVGKALMGQKVGKKVTVETPSGEVVYKIISINK
ncbi:MAG: transcription elongation factor GreA [Oscillospiraceae bacterium]|nr:transcription elongation factor GreA [Candidatus Equicaccousia limihippi]